ncbi:DedA family protein [Candidatus Micrarchaeota archaeon]|nr:DedA family protein [Candidatus Micrarchaeota archaeon]
MALDFSLLSQIEGYFFDVLKPVVVAYGGMGIAFAMFLESSILPVPSELILITAGLFFDPVTVAFWGTIGSTLGAMLGYYIGFKGGRPVVDKYGPYFLATPDRVMRAEKKFHEWGAYAVLIGRLLPFVPFKVFSITSGVLKYDFKKFTAMTFIGTLPRAFILASVGGALLQYKNQFWIALGVIVILAAIAFLAKMAVDAKKKK